MSHNEKIERIKEIIRDYEAQAYIEAEENNHACGINSNEIEELINFINLLRI